MAVVVTKVVMYDQVLYIPGHLVHRWMVDIVDRTTFNAIIRAPVRTGALKAGIKGETRRLGARRVEGIIASTAAHTMYVIEGTGFPVKGRAGRIYSTAGFAGRRSRARARRGQLGRGRGMYMRLPPGNGHGTVVTRVVKGQRPNNFLLKGYVATARRHASLRGLP